VRTTLLWFSGCSESSRNCIFAPETNWMLLPPCQARVDAKGDGSGRRSYGNRTIRISFLVTLFYDLMTLRVNTNPTPMGFAHEERKEIGCKAW
jgi:hypothetical protein